jgi:predicted DCC family thiol-disulfide oxidoreductase YuxK
MADPLSSPVLLFDARCGVCRRFVAFLVHADRGGRIRIAPLESPLGSGVRGRYPQFDRRDSAVWLPVRGRPSGFSDAILDGLAYVGGAWKLVAGAGRLVPRKIRDGVYRLFAGNRRYFGWLSMSELDEESQARIVRGMADEGG